MKKISFLLALLCLFGLTSFAADYKKLATQIEQRFEKAYKLYEEGKKDEAAKTFGSAYFEIFENLEGPIRINVSAKKSYALEAQFVDLRRMAKKGIPKEEIRKAIDTLNKELNEVLPELDTHTIVAEGVDGDKKALKQTTKSTALTFDENWQDALKYIEDDFKKAYDAYEPDNSKKARDFIKDAQFEGYRNTKLETTIRKELSRDKESQIQSLFPALVEFIHTKPTKEALKQKLDSALKEVAAVAKGLPLPEGVTKKVKKKKSKDYTPTVKKIEENFLKAFSLADSGKKDDAIDLIRDTYFDVFEASDMENAVGAKDPGFKTKLESYFSKIVSSIKSSSKDKRIEFFKEFKGELKVALNMLTPQESTPWGLLVNSLIIILREGLEALLIITAIVAYLVKTGNKNKMGIVYSSLTVAILLSFATAWAMNIIFGAAAGENRELLEGITMLVAAFLLFYVSYWLLSNAQAKKWNKYISDQVSESLSSGSIKALWFTVFLAVYREGAETVLFYQAFISTAQTSTDYMYLGIGFIIGVIILIITYFVLRFTAVKLPIKPFFIVTGIFIYVMSFMFVGQGVAELIEARILIPTLVDGVPTITKLGIYPYMQSLIPQGIVLILGIIGLFFIKRQQTRV